MRNYNVFTAIQFKLGSDSNSESLGIANQNLSSMLILLILLIICPLLECCGSNDSGGSDTAMITVLVESSEIPSGTGIHTMQSMLIWHLSSETFTITNKGTGELSLTGSPVVELSGTDQNEFSVGTEPALTIKAGESTTFVVQFIPTSAGKKTALISISNSAMNTPYTFTISADSGITGTADIRITQDSSTGSEIVNGDTIDLYNDTDMQKTFYIHNDGPDILYMIGNPRVKIEGVNAELFSLIQAPNYSILSSNSTLFTVKYTASAGTVVYREATLVIGNNDADFIPFRINMIVTRTGLTTPQNIVVTNGDNYADI